MCKFEWVTSFFSRVFLNHWCQTGHLLRGHAGSGGRTTSLQDSPAKTGGRRSWAGADGCCGAAVLLRVQSTRTMQRVLKLWRRRLTSGEKLLLARYSRASNQEDPFSDLRLTPQLGDASGPLLGKAQELNLRTGYKKTMYLDCVRVIHRRKLNNSLLSGESCKNL